MFLLFDSDYFETENVPLGLEKLKRIRFGIELIENRKFTLKLNRYSVLFPNFEAISSDLQAPSLVYLWKFIN